MPKYSVSVGAGAAFPTGDFADFYSTGFIGKLGVAYKINPVTDIYISAGNTLWKVDNNDVNKKLERENINAEVNLDSELKNIPVTVGVKLGTGSRKYRIYTGLAIVFNFLNLKTAGEITSGNQTETISPDEESFTKTSLAIEMGVIIPLSRKLELDIGGKYNAISDFDNNIIPQIGPVSDPVRAGTARYFSILAGVNYIF